MTRSGKNFGYFLLFVLVILSSTTRLALAQASNRRYARQETTGSAPHQIDTFVTAGNTRLHYVEQGSGRPVVMIHGNAGDLQDFGFGSLDRLARYYRVIAFDLPGHGLSKMPGSAKGTIQEQALILHQGLSALRVKDPILVGHSWGGAIALAYALLYPRDLSALVLLAPLAYSDHRHDAPLAFLLRVPVLSDACITILKPILGRKLLKRGLKQAFSPDPVPEAYYKAVAAVWLDRKRLKAFIKQDLMIDSSLQQLSPSYSKIRARVIIVTGDSDRSVSAKQNAFDLHRVIAHSELVVIPRAGHQIPEAHPEAILRAVEMAASQAPLTMAERDP